MQLRDPERSEGPPARVTCHRTLVRFLAVCAARDDSVLRKEPEVCALCATQVYDLCFSDEKKKRADHTARFS